MPSYHRFRFTGPLCAGPWRSEGSYYSPRVTQRPLAALNGQHVLQSGALPTVVEPPQLRSDLRIATIAVYILVCVLNNAPVRRQGRRIIVRIARRSWLLDGRELRRDRTPVTIAVEAGPARYLHQTGACRLVAWQHKPRRAAAEYLALGQPRVAPR